MNSHRQRIAVSLLIMLALTGCYCQPEIGEDVDGSYLSTCLEVLKDGPRNQVLFPKP